MRKMQSLNELCQKLSISAATGKNWLKLGKIVPQHTQDGSPFFTSDYISKIIKELNNSKDGKLKSRRNKSFKSGFGIYKTYIPSNSKNNIIVEKLLEYCSKESIYLEQSELEQIIAYYSKQLISQCCEKNYDLYKYLADDISTNLNIFNKYPQLKDFNFIYEKSTDILGLLYLSLRNIGQRKNQGAYYTPTLVVNKLISKTFDKYQSGTVTDPCCGSGNFMLQLPDKIKYKNIYLSDIDELGVKISRINFALKYNIYDKKFLYNHIKVQNFLTSEDSEKYDYIIGNPPWAYNFNNKERFFLQKEYKTAQRTNIESYDVVTEKALNKLNKNGILSFVLPESVLNVKAHKDLRKYIMDKASIKYIEYLGETFDGVQCPSIIMTCINKKTFNTKDLEVSIKNKNFIIQTDRKINSDIFNFTCDDNEYKKLKQIENIPNKITLKNNAEFALGIVTGDNKKYLSDHKKSDNEKIIKGADIEKFKIKSCKNYILFTPSDFQQCAPEKMYRAKEKLLYKFISKKPIFAYDDKQTLTLNSCNILIPKIEGLDIKYILGILNSDIVQFYFEKKFKSVKVLKSHIEQIPIPNVKYQEQIPIINIVDKIILSKNNTEKLIKELNSLCNHLYGIKETE